MYQRILLCTDGSPDADVAAEYALWLAQKLGAALTALYVSDIRILEGPLLADLSGALGAQPYPALLPRLQELQRQKADIILGAVADRCAQHNVPCTVIHETGHLVNTMLTQAGSADLVVLGQHGEHAPWAGTMLGSSVERLVRAAPKPCLVTPDEFRLIRHILIAYDGSPGATKALATGLELAVRLNAQVTLISCCQVGQEEPAATHLEAARQEAHERQLLTHAQLLHGHPETEILSERLKISADLIVMGAYGHTRIREMVLGSVTSQILRQSPVPVLLARG